MYEDETTWKVGLSNWSYDGDDNAKFGTEIIKKDFSILNKGITLYFTASLKETYFKHIQKAWNKEQSAAIQNGQGYFAFSEVKEAISIKLILSIFSNIDVKLTALRVLNLLKSKDVKLEQQSNMMQLVALLPLQVLVQGAMVQ